MHKLLAFSALVGFILSFAVHISALIGIDAASTFPPIWGLHIGALAVFFPIVVSARKSFGIRPTFAQFRSTLPTWVIAVGAGIFAYAIINFMFFIAGTEGGSPSISDGHYILQNHGKFIRELTQNEYSAFKANEVRGFSGHWLFFYFAPFAYFMFRKPRCEGS
jgi:hypothetical protein